MKAHPAMAPTLRSCRSSLVAMALFSLGVNVLTLAVPIYMLQLFDRVVANRSLDTLAVLTVAVVIALVALAALEAVRSLIMIRLGSWLEQEVSGPLLAASIRRALKKRRTPSIQALRDLGRVREFVSGSRLYAFLDAPWTPLFLLVIILLHPLLGLITGVGAVALLGLAMLNSMVARSVVRRAGEADVDVLDQAQAVVRNADVIEAMGMRDGLLESWRRRHAVALHLNAQASSRSGMIGALAKLLRYGLQIAVLGTAAWLVVAGELTSGAMIASVLLMRRALAPMDRAISSWKSYVGARSAFGRVGERLNHLPSSGPRQLLSPPSTGRLEVQGLTYRHERGRSTVLRKVSFELDSGEVLGLVGSTAAGKTTLARLLTGLVRPDSGHVRLDGVEVTNYDSQSLGPYLGYLPQDVELFAGTIGQNIARMGKGDPTRIIEAAQLANVHEMILRLPDGYETEIGEGGARLSGGQRQRIGLARAVYGLPKLVVLDEPDANLDREGQAALLKAVRALKAVGSTVVLITHRPEILRYADKILMLKRASALDESDAVQDGAPPTVESNAQVTLVPRAVHG